MKDFLLKVSLTSVIAIIVIVSGMGLLVMVLLRAPHLDENTRVQILAIVPNLMMFPLSYLYGAAKTRQTQASTNSGDVNVSPIEENKP